jgi:hypothetical protein
VLYVLLGDEAFKAGETPLHKVIKALLNALNGGKKVFVVETEAQSEDGNGNPAAIAFLAPPSGRLAPGPILSLLSRRATTVVRPVGVLPLSGEFRLSAMMSGNIYSDGLLPQ